MLWKAIYPYDYMESYERHNKTLLPEKKEFYSNLEIEDIRDVDSKHMRGVSIIVYTCKESYYY